MSIPRYDYDKRCGHIPRRVKPPMDMPLVQFAAVIERYTQRHDQPIIVWPVRGK